MDIYFIKGFIQNDYIGLSTHEVIDHFYREHYTLEELILKIISACKSLEDWIIPVRLDNIKTPFIYGLDERYILKLPYMEQIELLQKYCNIYLILYHISKATDLKQDTNYNNKIDLQQLEQMEGGDIIEFITEANKRIMDKFGRTILL